MYPGPEVERKGDGLHREGVRADEEAAKQHPPQTVRRRYLVCDLQMQMTFVLYSSASTALCWEKAVGSVHRPHLEVLPIL